MGTNDEFDIYGEEEMRILSGLGGEGAGGGAFDPGALGLELGEDVDEGPPDIFGPM